MTHANEPGAPTAAGGRVVVLSRDLFFGMRVRTVLRQLGYDLALVNDEATAVSASAEASPALVIVDFNQQVDWNALKPVIDSGAPVLAFGAHTDVEGFRTAKAAGVRRVVSNGEFSRRLPELLEQYRSIS